jgi:hypothetical protein
MLPTLAACLEGNNDDTNLNAGILSETEVHLLSLKEFSGYSKQSLSLGQISLHV